MAGGELGDRSTWKRDLAGEAASVVLTSDFPVTCAVISTSRRSGAAGDLALQSAVSPLVGLGVGATATTDAADSELILSNTGGYRRLG